MMSKVDQVYKKYHSLVNMSHSELLEWSKTECSNKASLDRSPIKRNLHLLSTPKDEWGNKEVSWANMTIGFISRMSKNNSGKIVCKQGGREYSKRDISLKNWAFDPSK